jgi:hypothetical protein
MRLIVLVLSLAGMFIFNNNVVYAGGGVVAGDNLCTMHIEFYSARFTAYQPNTRGNEEFCEDLPDLGLSIFVLDYLHASLKEVPVDFRIIKDVTGQGRFAKLDDVEALGDIEPLTVYYHPPEVRSNGSYQVEYEFIEEGEYIGVVTAGHPSNKNTYAAVFPFKVGKQAYGMRFLFAVLLAGLALLAWYRLRGGRKPNTATLGSQE